MIVRAALAASARGPLPGTRERIARTPPEPAHPHPPGKAAQPICARSMGPKRVPVPKDYRIEAREMGKSGGISQPASEHRTGPYPTHREPRKEIGGRTAQARIFCFLPHTCTRNRGWLRRPSPEPPSAHGMAASLLRMRATSSSRACLPPHRQAREFRHQAHSLCP